MHRIFTAAAVLAGLAYSSLFCEAPRCGIYLTSWVSGSQRINSYIARAKGTRINAFVVHIKDEYGNIYIRTDYALAKKHNLHKIAIPDLAGLVAKAKKNDIRLIGKIDCFKNKKLALRAPDLAVHSDKTGQVWRDTRAMAWVDPFNPINQDLNIAVARVIAAAGFDEVQFDYVRFPDGGDLDDCTYPARPPGKNYSWAIEGFLRRAVDSLAQFPVKVSADFFGITPWQDKSRLLGQHLARAGAIVDYIYPMIYPSHFPDFWYRDEGIKYSEPEKVISGSCTRGNEQLAGKKGKMRPWLQGFDYKVRNFGPDYIVTQVRAADESGCPEWFIWNARCDYSATWQALRKLKDSQAFSREQR